MLILLWVVAAILAIAVAYTMRFTQATLSFGRIIAETDVGTGVQDAITPPWQTNLAMLAYVGSAATIVAMWWQAGLASGLTVVALILFGSGVVGAFLPDKDSAHFRSLIKRSMEERHAKYLRDGKNARADAMAELLRKVPL